MARATDQETVMKLADEATNIKDDTLEIAEQTAKDGPQDQEPSEIAQPLLPEQPSICVSCKEERNITDLNTVDQIIEEQTKQEEKEPEDAPKEENTDEKVAVVE